MYLLHHILHMCMYSLSDKAAYMCIYCSIKVHLLDKYIMPMNMPHESALNFKQNFNIKQHVKHRWFKFSQQFFLLTFLIKAMAK